MSESLSDSALDQLFRTARTYNFYLDKPVAEAQLHAIWDLMKFGPTSANSLPARVVWRSEEHTSELQSLMRISYAVFCLKTKKELQLPYTTNTANAKATLIHITTSKLPRQYININITN